jgi:hypothetical protein
MTDGLQLNHSRPRQYDDPLGGKLRGYYFLAVIKMEMQATAPTGIAGCIRKRVENEIVVVH